MKNQKEQSDKFVKAAHELDCDMTQETFAETLKGIASVKPMTNAEISKKKPPLRTRAVKLVHGTIKKS